MNVEDIQLNDLLAEAEGFTMDRRDFLKTLGGGILILFSIGNLEGAQKGGRRRISYPEDLNAYLLIDNYGMVHCFTGKVEMGQGIMTSLAQMLAEELDAPLEAIKMVMGDTSQCPWDMGTFGSMTTKYFGPALRQAGAAARETLLQLASDHFQVPPDKLTTQGGTVFVTEDPKQKVLYAHLTKGKQIQRKVTGKPTLKPRSKYTISGRQPNRLDLLEKVMGKAQYAGDIRVPGMLYARLLRPPAHGAQLKSVNLDAVRNMKGVRVVRDKDLVAVLHEEPDMADRALGLIKAEFTPPPRR